MCGTPVEERFKHLKISWCVIYISQPEVPLQGVNSPSDFCIEDSTDKHDMAAKTIRKLAPFATKAGKPLLVLFKKSVIETAAVIVDMDNSHDKFNRLCKWLPGVFENFIRWGSIEKHRA